MSDKLKWMNQHFAVARYPLLSEAVSQGKYQITPELEPLAEGVTGSEEYFWKLHDAGKIKDACDFLCFILHSRAAVWWVYNCLISLDDELLKNPEALEDLMNLGKAETVPLPDWAKPPQQPPDLAEKKNAIIKDLQGRADELQKTLDSLPPHALQQGKQILNMLDEIFQEKVGYTLEGLIKRAAEIQAMERNAPDMDPDSPILKMEKDLRAKLEAMRVETLQNIKSIVPQRVPAHEEKVKNTALAAIYAWIVAPDEVNTQHVLNAGNACMDTPAGLTALAAYWAYGDLMPMGKQVVPTPPGLAANGLSKALLAAALKKGGTRNFKERMDLYLEKGLEVAFGRSNWSSDIEDEKMPHEKRDTFKNPFSAQNNADNDEDFEYKRWK